jgi:hypothetical protein
MLGAEWDDAALARAERHGSISKRDVERAAPDDYGLGRVVVAVPAPGSRLYANKADVDAALDGVMLTFVVCGELFEYRAKIESRVHIVLPQKRLGALCRQ